MSTLPIDDLTDQFHQRGERIEQLERDLAAAREAIGYALAYFDGRLDPHHNHPSIVLRNSIVAAAPAASAVPSDAEDAARYRWIMDNCEVVDPFTGCEFESTTELDAARGGR